jgi:hypothetical protein
VEPGAKGPLGMTFRAYGVEMKTEYVCGYLKSGVPALRSPQVADACSGPHAPTGTVAVTDHVPSALRVKGASPVVAASDVAMPSEAGQLFPLRVTGCPTVHCVVLTEKVVPAGIWYVPAFGVATGRFTGGWAEFVFTGDR